MPISASPALTGIKVCDFSWLAAGPVATECLATHGATVVKVESMRHPDLMRTSAPYAGGRPGINRAYFFASINADKLSIALNMGSLKGKDIAKRLVAWSDIVIENFTPGTMEGWGLGYEDCKKLRPDIIMVRASMQGQDGPFAMYSGIGTLLQSLAGFTYLSGWPDRSPVGSPYPFTDWIGAWYIAVAILGALDYRDRTGKGQCIDVSQFEAGISFLSPAVLDYSANSRIELPMGNRCKYAAPHGVYRCCGEDSWCSLAIQSDEEWAAFCKLANEAEWTADPRFTTLLGRKHDEDELDKLIEAWTVKYPAVNLMKILQDAGVPAGLVETGKDLYEDPQLKRRHHFWMLEHPEMGKVASFDTSFRLSKTPAELRRPAPSLGGDTEYVCNQLLGMSDQEFISLLAEGVFE